MPAIQTQCNPDNATLDWISAADPSLEWQVLRDLRDAPKSVWAPVRARVETEGWAKTLLNAQDEDGRWAGGTFAPDSYTQEQWKNEGQPWTATAFVLDELRLRGLPPGCDAAKRTVALLHDAEWTEFGTRFWEGEVEECINGRLLADGAYFGVDMTLLAARLVGEAQDEGGWNCERERGSKRSSIDSTMSVLEGLLEFQIAGCTTPGVVEARAKAEEYLLRRHLFRRLSTGETVHSDYLELSDEPRWRHDILRGLDYFRRATAFDGKKPDPRLADAIAHVRNLQDGQGRWVCQRRQYGPAQLHVGKVGEPSPIVTLNALRVLRWWNDDAPVPAP